MHAATDDRRAAPLALAGYKGQVFAMAFSADGALLASGGYDDTARV